ncbi:MAG: class I SAM-dependent methyltransferase, partial [bacterium]|nr:class I SAM-dependent methyltransferase [bacterium]
MSEIPGNSKFSFTAHYTGYVWYLNGLSDSSFPTWPGRFLYFASKPWMSASRKILGISDPEVMLLQRHRIIDFLLEKAVREKGVR